VHPEEEAMSLNKHVANESIVPTTPALNLAVVCGHLSRVPEELPLASGDVLVRYEVTVPRADERAETVPVVAVSPPAHARDLDAGTEVVVVGRTRRRFWSAGGATRSQVEVLATTVVAARRRAGATRALAGAVATLEAFAHDEE
jgi:single-strand DNA-binding protein